MKCIWIGWYYYYFSRLHCTCRYFTFMNTGVYRLMYCTLLHIHVDLCLNVNREKILGQFCSKGIKSHLGREMRFWLQQSLLSPLIRLTRISKTSLLLHFLKHCWIDQINISVSLDLNVFGFTKKYIADRMVGNVAEQSFHLDKLC